MLNVHLTFFFSGGRSPFTWYPQEYVDKVPMTDMNMRPNASKNFPGRTYRFYNGKAIYEFGHGLSYTTFSRFVISAPSSILIKKKSTTNPSNILSSNFDSQPNGQAIDVTSVNCQNLQFQVVIGVKNDGNFDGSHVVLMFWKPGNTSVVTGAPNKQLVGFDRVEVKRKKSKTVTLKLDVCKDLSIADPNGKRKLITGQHTFVVGSSSERQVKHNFNIGVAKSSEEGGFMPK